MEHAKYIVSERYNQNLSGRCLRLARGDWAVCLEGHLRKDTLQRNLAIAMFLVLAHLTNLAYISFPCS